MSVQTEIKDLIAAYEASQGWGVDRSTEQQTAAVGIVQGVDLLLAGDDATEAERLLLGEFKQRVSREVFGVNIALPTRYDVVPGHPLAGVPQAALDAATEALKAAATPVQSLGSHNFMEEVGQVIDVEDGDFEPLAHAVLAAALPKLGGR